MNGMSANLITLQNPFWQVGILPETGASVAFGRVKRRDDWIDVLRPTAESDYANSSRCSSFIMLPWCNRIRAGILRFNGQEYRLRTEPDDGTARHGDVRKRAWKVESVSGDRVALGFRSTDYVDVNYPFRFSARAIYWLERRDLVLWLALKNEDSQSMPGGFGHHPYFVRPSGGATPHLQIPCSAQFELVGYLAVEPPVLLKLENDFRQRRPLDDREYNDVLTARQGNEPAQIRYPQLGIELALYADPVFQHFLLFTPPGQPFFALEPMTNVNDGFNLHAQGLPGSGVFVLAPGEEKTGMVQIRYNEA